MSGIYYYIWYKESMNNHKIITEELQDIRYNLGCKWLLMDLEPDLFTSYDQKFQPALEHVIDVCKDIGLKIMPIPNIGSGMLPKDWLREHPEAMARDKNGKPMVYDDERITIFSYYSREALERLKEHTKFVLDLCKEVNYTYQGSKMVEIMEDVGYPEHSTADYNRWAKYPKETAVANFVGSLVDYTKELGDYKCIFKAFRGAQPFHTRLKNMGLDYKRLAEVADGQIDTIAPISQTPLKKGVDYGLVKRGLDLQSQLTKNKLSFYTVLCERKNFDPEKHLRLILEYPYTDIVWFNYNEGITVDTELKTDQEKRKVVIKLIKEYGL